MNTVRLAILIIGVTLFLFLPRTNKVQPQVQPLLQTEQKPDSTSGDTFKNSKITYKLIPGINKTWGYDIMVGNRIKIHQPSIPGQPGNEGFKTREGAEKVARLVIKKMK